jgi:hypothetical protein
MINDYECIIRHLFPHLELLVVLVDNGVVINEAQDNGLKLMGWMRENSPHRINSKVTTGPFTPISEGNVAYET